MHAIRLAVLLLVVSSASASPVITSITPAEGPVFGGATVIIRGSGFNDTCIICSPPFANPQVYFGTAEATDVRLVDSTTLEVVTPPHLPGTVDVKVNQLDGSNPNFDILENGYTYTGESLEAFEPVLFPIFTPRVLGAFGSEFYTAARVASRGAPLDLYGVDTNCTLIDPPLLPTSPFRIGATENVLDPRCSQSVGRLFYVARERADDLVANLRVSDLTRDSDSLGVEIPVVRRDEFVTTGRIVLLGVPIDPRYRNTLRIYGLRGGPQFVNVTINGVTTGVSLHVNDEADFFEPSVATFTSFPTQTQLPAGQTTVTVTIEDPLGGRGIGGATPIWAMVSVTNNVTQQITTITPN